MTTIPDRIWYTPREAAALTGMSLEYVKEALRNGRRQTPPAGAILPHQQRKFGTAVRVHRSWIVPDEPANVTPLRTGTTPDQIEDAMAAALVRFAREFIDGFAETRRGAA